MRIVEAEILSSMGSIPFLTFIGRTPKYSLRCGCCETSFKKGFLIAECEGEDRPKTFCPNCHALNEVPIWFNREEGEIRLDYIVE
jgi:hypothetical protein